VSVRPYFLEMDPKEFCGTELKAMLTNMPNAKASELEWIKIGDTDAPCADLELQMDGAGLKQFHCLAVLGGGILHFCGTAGVGDYDENRAIFLATVQSIRIEA